MLSIGTELRGAIESYDITAVSFLTLTFAADDVLRLTEAPRDIEIGSNTFISADNLAGLSAPDTQNSVDRDNYTVIFNDNDQSMRQRFAGITGVGLQVQLGFLDTNGNLISELLDVYKGQSGALTFRPDGDGFVTEVGFTGQLAQLGSTKTRATTPQSQAEIDPTDTAFQYVHDGVNDSSIAWGRKE